MSLVHGVRAGSKVEVSQPGAPSAAQVRAYLCNRDRDPDDTAEQVRARGELAELERARLDVLLGPRPVPAARR